MRGGPGPGGGEALLSRSRPVSFSTLTCELFPSPLGSWASQRPRSAGAEEGEHPDPAPGVPLLPPQEPHLRFRVCVRCCGDTVSGNCDENRNAGPQVHVFPRVLAVLCVQRSLRAAEENGEVWVSVSGEGSWTAARIGVDPQLCRRKLTRSSVRELYFPLVGVVGCASLPHSETPSQEKAFWER